MGRPIPARRALLPHEDCRMKFGHGHRVRIKTLVDEATEFARG